MPASLRLPEIVPNTLNVDWRQVRRWGIDENAIAGDAVVYFKAPTFIEEHRTGYRVRRASICRRLCSAGASRCRWSL